MATITKNEEKNGIEITFTEKPTSEVISWLKSNKYRWNPNGKVWYKKFTESDFEQANNNFKE